MQNCGGPTGEYLNRFVDYARNDLTKYRISNKEFRMSMFLLRREIQISEFFVVFFGGFVVGFCGLDFVFEVSEGDGIAISGDFSDETLLAGVPIYTLVF